MNYRKFWWNFKGRGLGEMSAAGKKRGWHPEGDIYDAGVAKGRTLIETDEIIVRWWDEVYVVPSLAASPFIDIRNENVFIRMQDLKKLEKKGIAKRIGNPNGQDY